MGKRNHKKERIRVQKARFILSHFIVPLERVKTPGYEVKFTLTSPQTRLDKAFQDLMREIFSTPIARKEAKALLSDLEFEISDTRKLLPTRPATQLEQGTYVLRFPTLSEKDLRELLAQRRPTSVSARPSPHGCTLTCLYEDEKIFALHKPSGMPSAPLAHNELDTVVNAALAHFPDLPEGLRPLEPGLLHRLDTSTSGAILFAKTIEAFREFRLHWKSVRKIYLALVPKNSFPNHLELPYDITYALAHDSKTPKKMVWLSTEDLQSKSLKRRTIRGLPLPALTRLLSCREFSEELLELEIEIQSGLMHQIRVHLAALACPIEGDQLYGGRAADRIYLHAWKIQPPQLAPQKQTPEIVAPRTW